MSENCAVCRFASSAKPNLVGYVRCNWIDGSFDEAGDRMPQWAFEIVAEHIGVAWGPGERAESCPAFDEAEQPCPVKTNQEGASQ